MTRDRAWNGGAHDDKGTEFHRRRDDAFVARWARRTATWILLPVLTAVCGVLWQDRTEKVAAIHQTAANLSVLSQRVTDLETRVQRDIQLSNVERQNILGEIRELRGEVRDMYRRAINAGGRNP